MAHWLVKSEAAVYGISQLKRDKRTRWDGVRNYQARNFLREMRVGDNVLFYHSSSEPTGIVGIAQVSKEAYPDPTQFDRGDEHFDPAATVENPRWYSPELQFVRQFVHCVTTDDLRSAPKLQGMGVLKRGNRLSVMPLSAMEFDTVVKLASADDR